MTGMKGSHSKFSKCSSLSGKLDTSLPHYDIEKIIKMRNLLNEHILLFLTEKKDGSGRNMSCDQKTSVRLYLQKFFQVCSRTKCLLFAAQQKVLSINNVCLQNLN